MRLSTCNQCPKAETFGWCQSIHSAPISSRRSTSNGTRTTIQSRYKIREALAGILVRLRGQLTRYLIQLCVYGFALRTFLGRRQYHLHCDVWRLTRQRNDLIHCDAGSDRCITQTGFANRFFHATGAQLSDVTQDSNDCSFFVRLSPRLLDAPPPGPFLS